MCVSSFSHCIAWRAPETFTSVGGRQGMSVKTDVYMFGCFMLEVITGREPLYWVGKGESHLLLRARDLTKSPLELAEAAGRLDVSGVVNNSRIRGTVDDVIGLIRCACMRAFVMSVLACHSVCLDGHNLVCCRRCLAASPNERPEMAVVTAELEGMMREKPGVVVHADLGDYGQVCCEVCCVRRACLRENTQACA